MSDDLKRIFDSILYDKNKDETILAKRFNDLFNVSNTMDTMYKKIVKEDTNLAIEMHCDSNLANIVLSPDQIQQINDYWEKFSFAFKNDANIQAMYTRASSIFSPKYMSQGLQWWYMWRFCEDLKYRDSFHDKNYCDLLTPNVKHPICILRKIKGLYYTSERNLITLDQAISYCISYINSNRSGKIIVKPSAGGGGYGIDFIRKTDSPAQIKSKLTKNPEIIIEDILVSHNCYAKFHPSSLNTLRIVSLFYNEEVTIISSLFRMGRGMFELDNYSQGGISCGIYPNGKLHKYGFDKYSNKYIAHPDTNIIFENQHLFGYGKIIQLIKKLHPTLPQFKHISWDFAINEEGEPVLMEFNTRGDVSIIQQNGDLVYGKYTDEILDDWLLTSFFKSGANWEYDYKEYSDHISISKCYISASEIVVPDYIIDKPVTKIEDSAFKDVNVDKIILPNTIKFVSNNICRSNVKLIYPLFYLQSPVFTKTSLNIINRCVEISWTNIENVDQYLLYRVTHEKKECIATIQAPCNSYVDSKIPLDIETCRYEIEACDTKNNKISGAQRSGRVRPAYINKVIIKRAGYISSINGIKIIWETTKEDNKYIITRECNGEVDILGETRNGSYIDKSVLTSESYVYEIYPNTLDSLRSSRTTKITVS